MKKPDWLIGVTRNGMPCECCGVVEYPYRDHIANYTTIGLTERYRHLEFQIVLDAPPEIAGYILNVLGDEVRNGARFRDGDVVDGIIEGHPVRIKKLKTNGVEMLRVLLPDANGFFPGDSRCDEIFALQTLPMEKLERKTAYQFPYNKFPS